MKMTGGGQTFDDFLRSIGIVEPQTILSFRRVIAWKLDEAIRKEGITRNALAARLRTRPADIELFLDTPETAPLLATTVREALAAVGEPLVTLWGTLQ
jgi:antitoxin HicB